MMFEMQEEFKERYKNIKGNCYLGIDAGSTLLKRLKLMKKAL